MVTGGVVIAAAAGLGLSTVLYPVPTLAGMVLICSVIYGVVLRRYLPTFFLAWLGLVLLGYALLGRGFAYLGAAPIYIGEVTLAFGVLAAIVGGRLLRVFRSPVAWLIVAFALWGAARTIPFIPRYGSDALRDGAVWGYGVFAQAISKLPTARCGRPARRGDTSFAGVDPPCHFGHTLRSGDPRRPDPAGARGPPVVSVRQPAWRPYVDPQTLSRNRLVTAGCRRLCRCRAGRGRSTGTNERPRLFP